MEATTERHEDKAVAAKLFVLHLKNQIYRTRLKIRLFGEDEGEQYEDVPWYHVNFGTRSWNFSYLWPHRTLIVVDHQEQK